MLQRWIGLVVALSAGGLHAQPDIAVPAELEGWRDWVLHEKAYRRCPLRFDSDATAAEEFVCAWPGELRLEVDDEGGRFEQSWTVYGDSQWIPLPGSAEAWPQQVSAGGRALEVVLRDGAPGVSLAAGEYRIAGRFGWDERPATLALPATSGLLSLIVDGAQIRSASVDARGVWLGDVEPTTRVPDSLVVDVFRRVVDEIPTRLDTLIRLHASGTVREEVLRPVLPAGFTPLALTSDLPAVMQPDGGLRLQARPGDWEIVLTARADQVLTEVGLPPGVTNMPAEEIWSFQPVPTLRAAVAEADRPVDPAQVGSPWTELPAFRIDAGGLMTVAERQRGLTDTNNELRLSRRLWLDFDGGGFVFADQVTGRMRADWRLDMAPPFALLGATEHGTDLQVTASDAGAGVEVRQADVDVEALGRVGNPRSDAGPRLAFRLPGRHRDPARPARAQAAGRKRRRRGSGKLDRPLARARLLRSPDRYRRDRPPVRPRRRRDRARRTGAQLPRAGGAGLDVAQPAGGGGSRACRARRETAALGAELSAGVARGADRLASAVRHRPDPHRRLSATATRVASNGAERRPFRSVVRADGTRTEPGNSGADCGGQHCRCVRRLGRSRLR